METFNAFMNGGNALFSSLTKDKSTYDSVELDQHSNTADPQNMDGSKSFQCQEEGCGKHFSSYSNLTRHSLIHSGERPFACEHCDKRFNQQGNLRKHLKSHENAHLRWNRNTTDKPFKCPHPDCHRSFTVKSSLQNHLLSHQDVPLSLSLVNPSTEHQLVNASPSPTSVSSLTSNSPTYSSILGSYDVLSSCKTMIKSRCLHSGCPLQFDTQRDLRSHLFSHAPGLAAEFKAMTNTMLNLIQMIETWDIKTPQEKAKNLEYVGTVKQALTDYPLLTDGPAINPDQSSYDHHQDKSDKDGFQRFVIHNTHDDVSVFSDNTNSEFHSDYSISSYFADDVPQQLSSGMITNQDAMTDYMNLDAKDEMEFLDSILESSNDLISDDYSDDQDLALCMDCKPTSSSCGIDHSTSDCSSCAGNHTVTLSNYVYDGEVVNVTEVQRYGMIASSLASPLLQARDEINQGWAQHLIPDIIPIEEHASNNGRKRRIIG